VAAQGAVQRTAWGVKTWGTAGTGNLGCKLLTNGQLEKCNPSSKKKPVLSVMERKHITHVKCTICSKIGWSCEHADT